MRKCSRITHLFGSLVAAVILLSVATARAQGTAFTYQGRLLDNGAPANGNYDLRFTLWNAVSSGAQLGGAITTNAIAINGGVFTVRLDFGDGLFTGAPRWLQVEARASGGGSYLLLSPRQAPGATPYAIAAGAVTGEIADAQLSSNVPLLDVPNTTQQATGVPVVTSGFITSANVTSGGSGYITPPSVTVNDVTGFGAVIVSQISAQGAVTNLMVQNAGTGYSSGATLTIGLPPSNAYQVFASTNYFKSANFLTNGNNIVAGTFTGNGANLTLSPNVALLNRNPQTFSGLNIFSNGMSFPNPNSTLQFPNTSGTNVPMMTMFASPGNADRMVLGHSPGFPDWGLQYQDAGDKFNFLGNGLNAMTVDLANQRVGIATNSPQAPLHVNGMLMVTGGVRARGGTPGGFGANNNGYAFFGNNGDNDSGMFSDADGTVEFYVNNIEAMRITPAARVGIGVAAPTFSFQLAVDSAGKPNGGSWATTSDARVKKNIRPMTDGLDKLTKLRGVTFEWVNPEDHANQTGMQAGFVAQEVEKVFPKWVQEVPGAEHDKHLTPDGNIKGMSLPFEFDALVVEAFRQLRAEKDEQIAMLEKANAVLKKELAVQRELTGRLDARFTAIERAVSRLSPTTEASYGRGERSAEAK